MQGKTKHEFYEVFLEFIASDLKRERSRVNRRMLNVFFWCFFLPSAISVTILLLVKVHVLPQGARSHLDWLILILPVFYSLYVLSSEVLSQVPKAFKKGGGAIALVQAINEGEWREKICDSMEKAVHANADEWAWIVASFKMDLQAMEYRTRYLTALAGAVFFLLMQGIDSMIDGEGKVTWVKTSLLGWVETSSNDLSQFVGLALFLVLLYLSGSQTYHSMARYLNCAELIIRKYLKD